VSWFWLNVPLMVLFAAAVVGIPLWLVLRRPDFGPETASRPGEVPARVGARYAQARAGSAEQQPRLAAARAGSAELARPAAVRARITDGARRLELARPAR
jgi:hypothetical protein